MHRRTRRLATLIVFARYAWVLWTGTASAMQSATYGNAGPVTSWAKLSSAADYEGCVVLRDKALKEFLGAHPQAVKRQEDKVYEKKAVPGDEEMIVHTATSFVCLPENIDPEKVKSGEYKPGEAPAPK
jgi:hypothetical protein